MVRVSAFKKIFCCILCAGVVAVGFSGCALKKEEELVTKSSEEQKNVDLSLILEEVAFDGMLTGFPITVGELPVSMEVSDNIVGEKDGVQDQDLGNGKTYASVVLKRKNDSQMIDIDLIRRADETYGFDESKDKMIFAVAESDIWEGEKILTINGIGIGDSIEAVLQTFGEPTEHYKASDEAGREDDRYTRVDYRNGEDCISFNSDDGAKISSISIYLESVRKKLTK